MEKNFDTMFDKCGGIVTFADDTTATVTDPDPDSLSEKVTAMYSKIAKYLTENRLVVNDGKTHLIVMCSNQRKKKIESEVVLTTATETIKQTSSKKLLGTQIHDSMKFREHILGAENPLFTSLMSESRH